MGREKAKRGQATIKVCVNDTCRAKGGEEILHNLKASLPGNEAYVEAVDQCFGHCSAGPNIAVNDNIIRGVKPFSAADRVRAELRDPSCKADGLGTKSLDDLDNVLDALSSSL